ncbi:MAG: HD domain-containing protein [Acidobacteria bacterium]|nr:HD domain-containing protein [Acidobacteriota bacterium]
MNKLIDDLKRYSTSGLAILLWLMTVSAFLSLYSLLQLSFANKDSLLLLALLALLLALISSRQVFMLPGTDSGISMTEAVTFLAIIVLGPYHAALLTLFEVLLASHRLRFRPSLYAFNISNHVLSVFSAGKVYYWMDGYLKNTLQASPIVSFALPLIAMAATHYTLHITVLSLMAYVDHRTRLAKSLSENLSWEPVTFMACATMAGLLKLAYSQYGFLTLLMTLVLVSPVPILIYYAFKTYHDNLSQQESHYKELSGIYDSIIEMLAMAIDAKDDVTHDHIQRVKLFARRMGQIVGLSDMEIEALKAGALLHDIGKVGVPAYILNKPGKLTEHEFEQMKMHTIIGADMLSNIDFRYPVVPIVRHHHERWDGRGYPDGLRGEAIPITARILTLVDTYDALRSDRPYHKAMNRDDAVTYMQQNAGSFYDPRLVEIFVSVVDEMEAEATALITAQTQERTKQSKPLLSDAQPANGLAKEPSIDRATAALNSIAETNQRVTALYEMSRTLSSILSIEDTIAILSNRLSKLIPFTTCAIALFDAERSEFEIIHAVGRYAESLVKRRQSAEAGITGWVITNQKPMYNTNPVLDLGFLQAQEASEYKGVMVFPLYKNNEALGAIALYSTEMESYNSEYIQLMESICQPASDAIYNALTFEQAQRAAYTDSITGLANTRGLAAQFDRVHADCKNRNQALSLLVLTLDNIESHSTNLRNANNQLLSIVGHLMKENLAQKDLLARYWDNAFIALLPNCDSKSANQIGNRIRKKIEQAKDLNLVVTVGSASSPQEGDSFEELLQAAHMDCIASRASFDVLSINMKRVVTG